MSSAYSSYGENLYGFVPEKASNLAGVILFAILWAAQTVLGFWFKQWWMLIAFFCGTGLECAGYIGRTLAHDDTSDMNFFLIQIICLTLGPAFIMVGIYYQLAKIVSVLDKKVSPIPPIWYAAIFAVCDLVSIVIQAAGGGIAAVAFEDDKSPDNGTHIMVAGIAWQVFSMSIYIVMSLIVAWNAFKIVKRQGGQFVHNPEFDETYTEIRNSRLFLPFCGMVAWCTLCIFIRSIYRVCELASGWTGYLIVHERYFLILDGLFVFLGCLGITIIHPGIVFGRQTISIDGVHRNKESAETKDSENESSNSNLI